MLSLKEGRKEKKLNLLILGGIMLEKPLFETIEPGISICHGIIAVPAEIPDEYECHMFIAFDEEARRIKNCSEEFLPVQLMGELKNYRYTQSGRELNFSVIVVKHSDFSINCESQEKTVKEKTQMMELKKNESFFKEADRYWKKCMWRNGIETG